MHMYEASAGPRPTWTTTTATTTTDDGKCHMTAMTEVPKCVKRLKTVLQCKKAVHELMGQHINTINLQAELDRPKGCWFQPGNSMAWFNTPKSIVGDEGDEETEVVGECSEDFQCLCCEVSSAQTTTATTSTPPRVR